MRTKAGSLGSKNRPAWEPLPFSVLIVDWGIPQTRSVSPMGDTDLKTVWEWGRGYAGVPDVEGGGVAGQIDLAGAPQRGFSVARRSAVRKLGAMARQRNPGNRTGWPDRAK